MDTKQLETTKLKAEEDIKFLEYQIGTLKEQIAVKHQIINNADYYIKKAAVKKVNTPCFEM